QHAHRASTQRFGAEVEVLGRFFSDPEVCAGDRQPSDAAIWNAVQLARPEGRLVELDRPQTVSYRQRGGNGRSEAVRGGSIAHGGSSTGDDTLATKPAFYQGISLRSRKKR